MSKQRTLSIVKPDGVEQNLIGEVFKKLEAGGLKIIAAKMIHMDKAKAEGFYAVHKERPFFASLVKFMTRSPVLVSVLEGDNAIAKNREVMGATDPAKAAPGTIRKEFARNIEENTVHGSDGPETAAFEISYFFEASEIF
jgi:nucleoside-diphosphate kinase